MPRPGPLTDEQIKKLVDDYQRGASIRAIGELRGWSYGYTHRNLHKAAMYGLVTVRPRGGVNRSSVSLTERL